MEIMRILAIIPAKSNSVRLHDKNMQKIGNRTLIEIAIDYAKSSNKITDIIVSTDSNKIKQFVESKKLCDCILRDDPQLSDVDVSLVYEHAWKVRKKSANFVIGLQPDNADRKLRLDDIIDYVVRKDLDDFFTVNEDGKKNGSVRMFRMPRQNLRIGSLIDNCINIHTREDLNKAATRILINSNPLGINRTFVIAEAACNHMCSLELAKAMIDCAANAGADAIKFQTYKGERIVTKYAPAFWGTETMKQTEYYKRLDKFNQQDYSLLFQYAEKKNILPFSTPFGIEDADMLNELGMKIFKIPSFEIVNLDLIRHIASFKKPIILSTGAANYDEIDRAIDIIISKENYDLALMACTLSYPTENENANLKRIQTLQKRYPNFMIGMSDHTRPDDNMIIPAIAVALGAKIIEKHYTMSRTMTGSGHFFSIEPRDLEKMIQNIRLCENTIGDGSIETANCEQRAKEGGRKSIVATRDIKANKIITKEMLTFKRPGTGICPSKIDEIIGKKAIVSILTDSQIKTEQLK